MSTPLNIDDLRNFAGDAASDVDSKLSGSLTFSDVDLQKALADGARAYNSVPPFGVHTVTADSMQTTTNLFFNACCAALFRRRVNLLSQQAVMVQAGNSVGDPDGLVRDALTKLADRMMQEFQQEARSFKGQLNMRHAYGIH